MAVCVRCGYSWTDNAGQRPTECRGCGAREWDKEVDLGPSVAAGSEYHIVEERQGRGRVTTLELGGVYPFPRMTARVELPHRLKDVYRKSKNDQRVEDPHDGVISFAIATDGEEKGKWIISGFRRRTEREIRREQTDACRRHQWAVRTVRESYDINAAGDRIHCACPAQCEVCLIAVSFAQDRRAPGSDGTRYWTDLQHAVARDLGLMA